MQSVCFITHIYKEQCTNESPTKEIQDWRSQSPLLVLYLILNRAMTLHNNCFKVIVLKFEQLLTEHICI